MQSLKVFYLSILLFSFTYIASAQPDRTNYSDAGKLLNEPIDSIFVSKSKRIMMVYNKGRLVKYYPISLGIEPVGRKMYEGDLKTPEGLYYINDRNKYSSYHKNLGISYPNQLDSFYARINGQSPGGEIKIHGFPNKHRKDQEQELLSSDWTIGCIAVADWEIDELYNWVSMYCSILIVP